jgi:Fic family protein
MFHTELISAYHAQYWAHIPSSDEYSVAGKVVDFTYMIESSALYSANIEGNTLDLNSFMNLRNRVSPKKKEVDEIENLIDAYHYAQEHTLTEKNFCRTHALSSKTLLMASLRWKYRNESVGVFWTHGLIYLAIEPKYVWSTMAAFFAEIDKLMTKTLSREEVFFYASMIHLVFVHIHPFADGNGRSARLLEKWFITEKLEKSWWNIPSERYYWDNRSLYYTNINLGVNYYELDYTKSLPFCGMLVGSL